MERQDPTTVPPQIGWRFLKMPGRPMLQTAADSIHSASHGGHP